MDKQARKSLLLAMIIDYIKTEPDISGDPDKSADFIFSVLLDDWDRLSSLGQLRLIHAICIICEWHGAESRAEAEASRIISRMMGQG